MKEECCSMKETLDSKKVEEILRSLPARQSSLLPMLQQLQECFNYLPREALQKVSERLEIPFSQVFRVATFYTAFSLTPRGRFGVHVCMGTACHVRGAPQVLDQFKRVLDIDVGDTTPDGLFSLETVNCVGACALSPVVVIGEEHHRAMTSGKVGPLIDQYRKKAGEGSEADEAQ